MMAITAAIAAMTSTTGFAARKLPMEAKVPFRSVPMEVMPPLRPVSIVVPTLLMFLNPLVTLPRAFFQPSVASSARFIFPESTPTMVPLLPSFPSRASWRALMPLYFPLKMSMALEAAVKLSASPETAL